MVPCKLVPNPEKDEGGTGDAEGQAGYIQYTIGGFVPQAAACREDMVLKHILRKAKLMPGF